MWRLLTIVAICGLSAAIKVPVNNLEEAQLTDIDKLSSIPIYHSNEGTSRLVLSNSQKPLQVHEAIETPATILLPPSEEVLKYYKRQDLAEQNDWYPIAPSSTKLPIQSLIPKPEPTDIIVGNFRAGKMHLRDALPPTPSTILLPPSEDALNFYYADTLSKDPGLPLSLSPFKQPTIIYPKKVVSGYKPVPIPIAQYADNLTEIPKAKPVKPFTPQASIDGIYFAPIDEKKQYLYELAEQKRKLKKEQEQNEFQSPLVPSISTPEEDHTIPSEQETSESIHDHPERNRYSTPSKETAKRPVYVPENKGERTEFRMHGMNGPHSYQFGYDTGKGKNRQFRYEERDNDGHVRGHYGYMDKNGKLRVVKYDADPKLGFRADPPVVQE
ncbi:unnamed protein product [Leptosia nina]|uniref:Cuticle protein n=1 Tax=Leptosia nina TaxID=320188 RepID=A0AAV1JVN5_9NEOP